MKDLIANYPHAKQPRTSGVIISKLIFPSLQDRDFLGLLLLNLLKGDGQHTILQHSSRLVLTYRYGQLQRTAKFTPVALLVVPFGGYSVVATA